MAFKQDYTITYPNGCGSVRITDTTTYGDGSSYAEPSKDQLLFKVVTVYTGTPLGIPLSPQVAYSQIFTYDKDQTVFDLQTPTGLAGLTFQVLVQHNFVDNYLYGLTKTALNTSCILPGL